MCRTEACGWIVRNSSVTKMRAIRLAVIPLSLGLVMLSGAARAGDDDRTFSEKLMDGLYGTIRGTNMDNRGIDYRERSPLVVPPTLDLPPPASTGNSNIANWPKDPDERKRKAIIAEKKKNAPPPGRVRVSTDETGSVTPAAQPINIAPPVEAPATPETVRPAYANDPNGTARTDPVYDKGGDLFTGGAQAISDALGTSSLFGSGKRTVEVQPGTEPVREALTQPPAGYQVPSANYEYGPEKKGWLDGQANPDRNPLTQRSSATSVVH
jgi:hypothetical protein